MKWIIAVVAVGAAVAAVSGGDVPVKTAEVPLVAGGVLDRPGLPGHALGPLCREGHVWKQDCNTCSCLMGRAACTEMACPAGADSSDSSDSSSSEEAAEGKCKPGTSWRADCNSCHCSSNGHAMCTAMACAPSLPSLPKVKRSLGAECTPGSTWKKDCNTCTCSGGRAACTLMACLDLGGGGGGRDNPALRPVPVDNQCAPGTSWNDGCNNCRCTSSGVSICTQRACLDLGGGGGRDNPDLRPVPVDNQCAPGTSWNDGCNNCRCTSTGVAICTQRACLHHHKRDVADVSEPSEGVPHKGCTPGETWKNDCNNCRCTPGGIPACTKKRCIKPAELEAAAGQGRRRRELTEPSEGVPHKGCTPGETWKNDCNNCRCTPSGIPACTKMRCIKPPQPEGN